MATRRKGARERSPKKVIPGTEDEFPGNPVHQYEELAERLREWLAGAQSAPPALSAWDVEHLVCALEDGLQLPLARQTLRKVRWRFDGAEKALRDLRGQERLEAALRALGLDPSAPKARRQLRPSLTDDYLRLTETENPSGWLCHWPEPHDVEPGKLGETVFRLEDQHRVKLPHPGKLTGREAIDVLVKFHNISADNLRTDLIRQRAGRRRNKLRANYQIPSLD